MSKSRALVCLLSIAAVFSSLSYAAAPDRIPGPITAGSTVALPGGVHRKALRQYDQGRVEPTLQFGSITLHTAPTPAQQKALTQLLADQQNRNSPNYHKWLTPEQWADRFGLSQNDIQQITSWLASEGFTIRTVARGHNWVTVSGTAAQVERVFGTEIHYFNVNGELHVANATSPKIPAALSGLVTDIRGLDDFHLRPRAKVRPSYYDASIPAQFVAPGDIATIYDINPLYSASTPIDGTGQKLAIIGQTDIYLSDLNDFRSGFGFTPISTTNCTTTSSGVITSSCNDTRLHYIVADNLPDPGVPLTTGDLSEADTDIETAGGVARNAQIVYVNAPATFSGGGLVSGGVFEAWYYAVDQDLAPVISMSYGNCEFNDNNIIVPGTGADGPDETELKKANSEGITFVNSTGDSGAAECDPTAGGTDPNGSSATQGIAVGYPASSPEVTGVGGTATPLANFTSAYWNTANNSNNDGGSATGYVPEQTWNDDDELAQFCSQSSTNTFCTQGGSKPVSGWKPVTSAQIMQEDLAIQGSGISSGGGGASNCATQNAGFTACVSGFPQPAWQKVTISGQSSARFSPDVSFLASPNFPGYIFCTELSELGQSGTGSSCASGIQTAIDSYNSLIGGTSISAPVFAGIVALMNQYLGTTGLGNVNPTLYTLAAVTPSNGAFNRVNTGDNDVYCTAATPSGQPAALQCPSTGVLGFSAATADATTGYNLATGLGSVDVNKLAGAWKAEAAGTFTLTPTAASFQVAQGSSVNATVQVNFGSNFTGTVSFTCTDPASESTCTAPGNTNKSGSVSFNITTTLPTAESRPPFDRGTRILYAALLPGLFGIVITAGSRKRFRGGMRVLGMIAVLALSTVWMASCGGSSSTTTSNPGTPKGNYTITVKGTSGSTNASTSFQLVVQ